MVRVAVTGLLLVGALTTTPMRALTVVPATFEELVRESVAVVHGRVRDVRAAWTADRRTIHTAVTVDVITPMKGADVETATFVVPGGEAGGRILVVPGAPTFRAGDEVVLFLAGRAPALPSPVGLSLGVYRVSNTTGGVAMVAPSPVHAHSAGPVRRGSLARGPRTLEAFAAEVRAALEAR